MKLLVAPVVALISACAVWPAGSDPRGRELKANGEAVLTALARYQQQHGRFPTSLAELAPSYLPAVPARPELRFNPVLGSVSFVYSPSWPQSGQVSCSAEVGAAEWSCHGYI